MNKENTGSSPFNGCTVVATGKLVNFTRSSINSKIASLGATAGTLLQGRRIILSVGKNRVVNWRKQGSLAYRF